MVVCVHKFTKEIKDVKRSKKNVNVSILIRGSLQYIIRNVLTSRLYALYYVDFRWFLRQIFYEMILRSPILIATGLLIHNESLLY